MAIAKAREKITRITNQLSTTTLLIALKLPNVQKGASAASARVSMRSAATIRRQYKWCQFRKNGGTWVESHRVQCAGGFRKGPALTTFLQLASLALVLLLLEAAVPPLLLGAPASRSSHCKSVLNKFISLGVGRTRPASSSSRPTSSSDPLAEPSASTTSGPATPPASFGHFSCCGNFGVTHQPTLRMNEFRFLQQPGAETLGDKQMSPSPKSASQGDRSWKASASHWRSFRFSVDTLVHDLFFHWTAYSRRTLTFNGTMKATSNG